VITAIAAALLGAGLGGRIGTKRVYMIGLAAGLVSMALLLVSSFVTDDQTLAYALLLLVTASLGAGFGFTVPALNTFTAAFNPTAVSRSILVLNALLGLGTVPAPVFVPAEEVIRKARAKVIRGRGCTLGAPLCKALFRTRTGDLLPRAGRARPCSAGHVRKAAERGSRRRALPMMYGAAVIVSGDDAWKP
jgi:hypothetical protein